MSFAPINLSSLDIIDFKSNDIKLPDDSNIPEVTITSRNLNNTIDKLKSAEKYIEAAQLLIKSIMVVATGDVALMEKGKAAYDLFKKINETPQVEKEVKKITGPLIDYTKNTSSNLLSVITMRRDTSSLDPTQWGKGKEFATKFGMLSKTNENTKKMINDSYKKLCMNMNRAQSLQLNLNIAGLNMQYGADSFAVGQEKLIEMVQDNPIYGFVKGAATAYNNQGDSKMYEVLDNIVPALGLGEFDTGFDMANIPGAMRDVLLNIINTALPPPLNLLFILYVYNRQVKLQADKVTTENLAIQQKTIGHNDDYIKSSITYTVDWRGTPISNTITECTLT